MAIKKSLTVTGVGYVAFENSYFETGETTVTTPVLYIKVESVTGSKSKVQAIVSFTDESKGKKLLEKSFVFSPSMDAGNFIAQAYIYLKTLPEFAGAIDC
jgi:hypothetical protein